MHKLTFTLMLLLIAIIAKAVNDTTKILFIGNSLTYTYDVPQLVQQLGANPHLPVKFTMHAPGGMTVGDIRHGMQAHMNNPVVYDYIRSDNWDFVVVQDNQGRFMYPNLRFPNPITESNVIGGHLRIQDSVKYYHPCAHMVWFAGWAFKNGYPGYGSTGEILINQIYANYSVLNDTAHEIISPIGLAWNRTTSVLPQPDLWSADETHQSLAGSYLTAAVLFTTIFRIDPENLSFNAGLDSQVARTLRRIAYETVTDSIEPTNLNAFVPSLQLTGNLLTAAPGYSTYDWYKDGVLVSSGNSNLFTTTGFGYYQVIVTGQNACTNRSFAQYIINTTGIPSLNEDNGLNISPNPAQSVVNVEIKIPDNSAKQIVVSDAAGRSVYAAITTESKVRIPTDQLPEGFYIVSLKMHGKCYQQKLFKVSR